MKNKKPLCPFSLFLKKGKNLRVTFGIPKEPKEAINKEAAPKTRVNPNSSAENILGNNTIVLIAPNMIPKYEAIEL